MHRPVSGPVVLGIGSRDYGDDAAGPAVIDRLRAWLTTDAGSPHTRDIQLLTGTGEPGALLAILNGALTGAMTGAGAAYLIDACCSGSSPDTGGPGTIHRIDVAAGEPLPTPAPGLSTHGLGLAEALALARALDAIPPVCVLYAIEGTDFSASQPLSASVAAAVAEVADRLIDALSGDDVPRGTG